MLEEPEDRAPFELFPQDRVIPLYEVLETVNRVCQFSDTFEAARLDHQRQRPASNLFLAGIIGLDGRPLISLHSIGVVRKSAIFE